MDRAPGRTLATHRLVETPLDLLAEITRDFASSLDLETTLRRAVARIVESLHVEAASLFLSDDGDGMLRCECCVGPIDLTGLRLMVGQGIIGSVVASGQPQLLRDVRKHPAFSPLVDEHGGFVTRSLLCVPLMVRNERLGALELLNKRDADGLFSEADLDLASAVAAAAALAIHNTRMVRDLLEQARVRRELELAREIQLTLLPADDQPLPIHGLNLPARRVSGDFYDYLRRKDGRIYFSIADVAGKGMQSSLLMAKAISVLRCLARTASDPASLLAQVNAELHETISHGLFVTIVAGFIDETRGELVYANAGHHPPLLRLGPGRYEVQPVMAPPLGVGPVLRISNQRIMLGRGDIYLYTDGITEARDAGGQALGLAGLLELLDRIDGVPAAARPAALVAALGDAGRRFHDDVTVLVLAPGAALRRLAHVCLPAEPRSLAVLRRRLREALLAAGVPGQTTREMVMAVNEASMNVIQHAYPPQGAGALDVDLAMDDDAVDVLLLDSAPPVVHAGIAPRDLSDLRPGGLGTHFIQSAVDEWQYGHLAGGRGNTLRLRKRWKEGQA